MFLGFLFDFFIKSAPVVIQMMPDIKTTLDLILKFFFAFGVIFEIPVATVLLVMSGVCGGFTTFSAFSLQTVVLLRAGDFTAAGLNVVLSVMLCLAATFAGHLVAMRTV